MSSMYNEEYGPNVTNILVQGSRVIRGKIPAQVRKELMVAVKAKVLGRFAKDGLKPEIFFHPNHKHGAADCQKSEALYAVGCIASVMAGPADYGIARAEIEAKLFS